VRTSFIRGSLGSVWKFGLDSHKDHYMINILLLQNFEMQLLTDI